MLVRPSRFVISAGNYCESSVFGNNTYRLVNFVVPTWVRTQYKLHLCPIHLRNSGKTHRSGESQTKAFIRIGRKKFLEKINERRQQEMRKRCCLLQNVQHWHANVTQSQYTYRHFISNTQLQVWLVRMNSFHSVKPLLFPLWT